MIRQTCIPGIGGILVGELIVDLFAGGGGASHGIEMATGRPPDIAINHDPHAIQMHEQNHPATRHYCQSVFHREVHPTVLVGDQRVGLLWLSPDCRHFSRARGAAPVSASVRALCWIGLRWAKFTKPRIVVLENVPEFVTAGPLDRDNKPIKARAGEHFRAFIREWKKYGYTVEWRTIICADQGAPTTRKRLFLVARCDGEAITWPEPSHTKLGKPEPWRTAAGCIDWSIPCPSIFERKKPLAPATCRRIARGIARYVLQGKPFIMPITHGTDHFRGRSLDEPMATITTAHRGEQALVSPVVVRMGHGDKQWNSANEPLTTVTAQGNHHALVAAFLAKHNGGATGQPLSEPLHTITSTDTKAVISGSLIQIGARHGGGDQALDVPVSTVLTTERFAVVAAFLVQYYSQGSQDQALTEPMATIVTRARHGLVTVTIDGTDYALVDIGMRMLSPRELARAQGFPDDYILTGTKSQQIARIGNSVCPPVAAAIVAANLPRKAVAA
jgi:DNA (cytosine-5)-methyltransferase 1